MIVRLVYSSLLIVFFGTNQLSAQTSREQITQRNRSPVLRLQRISEKLKPLHQRMLSVQPGDWLLSHPEAGQSFRQYVDSKPIKLTPARNKLYVLPMGEFTPSQQKIITLNAEFLGIYFGCTVVTLDTVSASDLVPADARRVHPTWGMPQIKSTYVLESVLPARLPDDGVALICLTSADLYPGDDWNFVFGQATYRDRVGVWSLYRNGDPATEFKLCLKRTLRTATHETGHMFSLPHCTAYECNMCGSNSMVESDRRPLYLCPECVAKVAWATHQDLEKRFKKLLAFCQWNELADEAEYYAKAILAMQP